MSLSSYWLNRCLHLVVSPHLLSTSLGMSGQRVAKSLVRMVTHHQQIAFYGSNHVKNVQHNCLNRILNLWHMFKKKCLIVMIETPNWRIKEGRLTSNLRFSEQKQKSQGGDWRRTMWQNLNVFWLNGFNPFELQLSALEPWDLLHNIRKDHKSFQGSKGVIWSPCKCTNSGIFQQLLDRELKTWWQHDMTSSWTPNWNTLLKDLVGRNLRKTKNVLSSGHNNRFNWLESLRKRVAGPPVDSHHVKCGFWVWRLEDSKNCVVLQLSAWFLGIRLRHRICAALPEGRRDSGESYENWIT